MDLFLMKVCVKKEVCESCEQCTGPTDRHISMQNLLVKEVMGPVHGAWDPLTDNIPHENTVLN